MSWVPSPAKKKLARQDMCGRSDIRGRSRGRRRGVGLSRSIWSSRMICGEGFFHLLVARKVEIEGQAWVGISSLPLKGKPPRSPLSTILVPQSPYNFVPLSDQSYLLVNVPTQSTSLLSQAFRRAYSLRSLETSSVQQHCHTAKFVSSHTLLFLRTPQLTLGCKELIHGHLKLGLGRL